MAPRPRRSRHRRRSHVSRLRFNLGKALFVLPNLFTISSIFCGFYAILIASGNPGPAQLYRASLAICFSIFFDMADGRVARLTRTQSDFGVQLDSLADVISFGVAPAVVVYRWALSHIGHLGLLVAFAYIACGAMRLARFNVLAARAEPENSAYFLGLPIPLAAGVVATLVMFHQRTYATVGIRVTHALALVIGLSVLMVSNVRYRTFKHTRASWQTVGLAIALMGVFAVLARRITPAFACLAFFTTYIVVGLVEGLFAAIVRQIRPSGQKKGAAHG